jgi:hypothetical protein
MFELFRIVVLSEVSASRSEAFTQSKDLYRSNDPDGPERLFNFDCILTVYHAA